MRPTTPARRPATGLTLEAAPVNSSEVGLAPCCSGVEGVSGVSGVEGVEVPEGWAAGSVSLGAAGLVSAGLVSAGLEAAGWEAAGWD